MRMISRYFHRVSDYINDPCMPCVGVTETLRELPRALWVALWNRQMYED